MIGLTVFDTVSRLPALSIATASERAHVENAVQLAIEYDPDPPFTAGSPRRVPPGLAERALALGFDAVCTGHYAQVLVREDGTAVCGETQIASGMGACRRVWLEPREPPAHALTRDGGIAQPDRVRIRAWAEVLKKVAHTRDVYGFFNNHFAGHSPANAREMQSLLGQRPVDPATLGQQRSLF